MSSTSSLAIRRRISLLDMDRLHSPYSWPKSGRHQRVRDFTTESTATKEVRHAKTLRLKLLTSRDEDDEAEDSKAAEKILEDDAESLSDDDMSYGQDSNDRQIRDTQSKDTQLHDRIWSAMAPFEYVLDGAATSQAQWLILFAIGATPRQFVATSSHIDTQESRETAPLNDPVQANSQPITRRRAISSSTFTVPAYRCSHTLARSIGSR